MAGPAALDQKAWFPKLGLGLCFTQTRLGQCSRIHDRSAARAALVMAADEIHAGGLSAPGAAVGHRLIQDPGE